jgi:hypothetical protein
LGKRWLRFIGTNRDALPTELTMFASANKDGDKTSVNAAWELLRTAEAYDKKGDAPALAEGIRQLNTVVPLPPVPRSVADDSKLLWRDGVKIGIFAGVMLAEWALWGMSLAHDNEIAKVQGANGRTQLASTIPSLVILTLCVNFGVNRLKIP